MRLSAEQRVVKSLQDMLDAELSTVLRAEPKAGARVLSQGAIHALSKDLARRMVENTTLIKAFGQIAIKNEKQWLTTEEAAKLSGFSRTFIVAMFNSGLYTGSVERSPGGHRRILASDFKHWRAKNEQGLKSVDVPKTIAQVRSGVVLDTQEPAETAKQARQRRALSKRALATARELGLA